MPSRESQIATLDGEARPSYVTPYCSGPAHESVAAMPAITPHLGRLFIGGAALVPVVLWGLAGAPDPPVRAPTAQALGQLTALVGTALFALSFVLAARLRWLEDYFGGLDKMYSFHHTVGLTAFGLLLAHPVLLALRFLPDQAERMLWFLLPLHARGAVNWGVVALWGLVLLIGLTLWSRIRYDTWKVSHRFMAIALLMGGLHVALMEPTRGTDVVLARFAPLRVYMFALIGVGLIAAGYSLLRPWVGPRARFTTQSVHRLNDEVLEIELAPRDAPLDHVPGQYVFVTFLSDDLPRESHPFTICSPADEDAITIMVKMLGDFTGQLYQRLEAGTPAQVEGPYGRFDYRQGGDDQIWIAGGVGVAPFLSWARHMTRHMAHPGARTPQVDFYYCVHSRGDAVYHDELAALSDEYANLNLSLVCSTEDGHLHASDVDRAEDADIFICGPKRLITGMTRQFRARGVTPRRIHFEDFEFRT